MTKDEALKLALEVIERYQIKRQDFDTFADVIAAGREALATPPLPVQPVAWEQFYLDMGKGPFAPLLVQEPVAWADKQSLDQIANFDATIYAKGGFDDATPLYTAPPLPVQIDLLARCETEMRYAGWIQPEADNPQRQELYIAVCEALATPPLPAQPKVRTGDCLLTGFCAAEGHKIQKAQPVQRSWVGLTDDEVYRIAFELEGEHWKKIADAIEAKLKEKNNE